jgi:hypothetical protein
MRRSKCQKRLPGGINNGFANHFLPPPGKKSLCSFLLFSLLAYQNSLLGRDGKILFTNLLSGATMAQAVRNKIIKSV